MPRENMAGKKTRLDSIGRRRTLGLMGQGIRPKCNGRRCTKRARVDTATVAVATLLLPVSMEADTASPRFCRCFRLLYTYQVKRNKRIATYNCLPLLGLPCCPLGRPAVYPSVRYYERRQASSFHGGHLLQKMSALFSKAHNLTSGSLCLCYALRQTLTYQ